MCSEKRYQQRSGEFSKTKSVSEARKLQSELVSSRTRHGIATVRGCGSNWRNFGQICLREFDWRMGLASRISTMPSARGPKETAKVSFSFCSQRTLGESKGLAMSRSTSALRKQHLLEIRESRRGDNPIDSQTGPYEERSQREQEIMRHLKLV